MPAAPSARRAIVCACRDRHAVVVATTAWQSLPKASTDDFVQLFDILVTELLPAL